MLRLPIELPGPSITKRALARGWLNSPVNSSSPGLAQAVVAVEDQRRPTRAAVRRLVLETQRIIDRPLLPADRDTEAGQHRIGEIGPEFGAVAELAADRAAGADDDVGDLPG
jgi:hypothetical protein